MKKIVGIVAALMLLGMVRFFVVSATPVLATARPVESMRQAGPAFSPYTLRSTETSTPTIFLPLVLYNAVPGSMPPTLKFDSSGYSVEEGAGTATVIVTLRPASEVTVTVDYATLDNTAQAGDDYAAASGTLSFAPGQRSRTFTVTVNDDPFDELDEMVNLTLSNPLSATLGIPHTVILTIMDDDAPPTVQLNSSSYDAHEGAGPATISATLSVASGMTVTVDYATSDGTAQAGDDYAAINGTLTFLPGETSQAYSLEIFDDPFDEPDETLNLTLSNAVSATLGTPYTATLTIVDDDEPLTVQFNSSSYSAYEEAGTATVIATLSAASSLTVTVDYATSDGTAQARDDYTASSGTLTFVPGETSRAFSLEILDDPFDEPDETVNLALNDPGSAVLGMPYTATLTISDDDETPAVQFNSGSYSVHEGAGTATVVATLSASSGTTVTVDYATSDGTAQAGDDYVTISGTLTFVPGETSQSFSLEILDDPFDETDETVNLTLSNPVSAVLGIPYAAALTIADNDRAPTVQFNSNNYSVYEGTGTATVIVTLGAASNVTVTVDYATSDGTAQANDDYVAISGTLGFAPGQMSRTLTVTVNDDPFGEPDETVNLTLSNPVNAVLGTPYTATLTISDSAGPLTVQFNSGAYSVHEGAGTAMVIATLSAAFGTTVTVDYATSDGTAQAGDDYTAISGTLTFAPGETSQVHSLEIFNDPFDEPDETVNLTLNNPVGAVLGTPYTATLTIVDNDEPLTVQFSSSSYSVHEGAGAATVIAALSAASSATVTVDYATSDGTAQAGDDYAAISGTLSFAAGQMSQTFTLTVNEDPFDEPDETLNLALSSPVGAILGAPYTATLTIVDNDGLPTVQFNSGNYSVHEGAGTATVIAALSAASSVTVTVDYATSDGTAQAGVDYAAVSGTLTFAPGETSRAFSIEVFDDPSDELDETVALMLSSPVSATLGTLYTATLTITDDDAPPTVQFSDSSYSVHEEAGLATVTATLSVASSLTVTVDYATSDGTAQAGADYVAISGTLSFMPGETSQVYSLEISNDPHDETDETLDLALNSPVNATLGTPDAALLTIVDGDAPSRFGVQVALHQIESRSMELENGALVRPQTEDEWLAFYQSAYVTLTQALMESGAGWTRVGFGWQTVEPNPPEPGQPPDYVWWPGREAKLRLLVESGVRLIFTVAADTPDWAADVPCGPIYPDRLDEFARFLTDLVNRYKGPPFYVKHWELLNEPDYDGSEGYDTGWACWGNDADQYAQMLAVAYPAIKAADPEATVLMGGLAYDRFTEWGGPFLRYFPDEVMENGGGDYIDALNMHYFPVFHAEWDRWVPPANPPTCGDVEDGEGTPYEVWGIDLIAKTSHLHNRMNTCFGVDKPVWVTEVAEHGYPGSQNSLAQQARYVILGNVRGLAAGVENITWYALTTPNDNWEFQLLFDDWTPKPAFHAYQTLTSELSGYEYARTLDASDVEGYVFQDLGQQEKTVAWGSATLTFAAQQLRVVDHEGNETFIEDGGAGDEDGVQNGVVELQLSEDPVFVTVSN